jgi:hypothetical protein
MFGLVKLFLKWQAQDIPDGFGDWNHAFDLCKKMKGKSSQYPEGCAHVCIHFGSGECIVNKQCDRAFGNSEDMKACVEKTCSPAEDPIGCFDLVIDYIYQSQGFPECFVEKAQWEMEKYGEAKKLHWNSVLDCLLMIETLDD